jgi:hypothetical protein
MTRLLLIVLGFVFTSFQKKKGVEISFVNDSEETFVQMAVETNGNKFSFFNICPGERTNPVTVDQTYWFIHTEVITRRDTVLFTGFCRVGETLIKDGQLTVFYALYPKKGERRSIYASEVSYTGSAKNVGFPKFIWKENKE